MMTVCPKCNVKLKVIRYSLTPLTNFWYKYYKFECPKCNYNYSTEPIYWKSGTEPGYVNDPYKYLKTDETRYYEGNSFKDKLIHYVKTTIILSGPLVGFYLLWLLVNYIKPN